MRKIGAHVSASGGIDKAIERAKNIGCNCVQIFSGSPRVWRKPALESIDHKKVSAKSKELDVSPIFTHALYLVNLASDNPELLEKSKKAIAFDLQVDARLNGAGVIVHLGSHQGRGWEAVKNQVATAIKEILDGAPENCHFLMENAAGQQGKIGGDLHELRWLLDQVKSPRLGWCFDTCHGFASGYGLLEGDGKSAAPVPLDQLEGTETPQKVQRDHNAWDAITELDLISTLRCIHVNDSRDPFGSGRDRHDNLGDGSIGSAAFTAFLNHPKFAHIPMILEVPGLDDDGPDAENVNRLKKIVGE